MATTLTAQLTLGYDDDTTRNVNFDDMTLQGANAIKARAKALNVILADNTQNGAYRDTFISNDGSPIKQIKAAKYTQTEEQVIYNG